MRPGARRADHHPQRALAPGLDVAAGGFAEDGEVSGQPVRQVALDAAQPVGGRLDVLVGDPGELGGVDHHVDVVESLEVAQFT
nr:hypothetical protein CPGR_03280 [Mycolicibacter nonchromogenicus]